jgi:rhodanese-related sulfurtransferase
MAESITPEELKQLLEAGEGLTLLDVRRKADYEAAPEVIRSAAWRDPEAFAIWSAQIPQDSQVVVYCVKGGSVSQSVAEQLMQTHAQVRFLQGGRKAWIESGGSVE